MRAWVWTAAALAACGAPDEVLHHCDAAAGEICPWAGTGDNGYNGEGNDKLDTMFSFPMSVTFSPYGLPVIADWNNHKLREVAEDGTITTIMGTDFLGDGDPGRLDSTEFGAPGLEVNLNHPTMQVYQADGVLLSASWHTHKLRTWDPETGLVRVVLGAGAGMAPAEPADDRGAPVPDTGCLLNQVKEIALDANENVFILDMRNERIRHWDRQAGTIRTVAGKGLKGNDPANAEACTAQSGNALDVCFSFPKNSNPEPGGAIALNADETVMYIADTERHVIHALDLASGTMSVLAGGWGEAGYVDAAGSAARLNFPTDLVLDGDTLFVADANNHVIRAVDVSTGAVSTFAGTGEPTCADEEAVAGAAMDATLSVHPRICEAQRRAGDGGDALSATFFRPMGVDLDLDGNLVVADTYNHRFRVITR
jgi:hypothetical protein